MNRCEISLDDLHAECCSPDAVLCHNDNKRYMLCQRKANLSQIHTADASTNQLSSWLASALAVWTKFTTSSRRLPTDSVDNMETDQTMFWSQIFWVRGLQISDHKCESALSIRQSLVTNDRATSEIRQQITGKKTDLNISSETQWLVARIVARRP